MIYDGCGRWLKIVSRAMSIAESSEENINENEGSRYEVMKEDERNTQLPAELTLKLSV